MILKKNVRPFASPLDRLKAAQSLPLGHYERTEAERRVHNEYHEAGMLEARMSKIIPRDFRRLDRDQICWLVWVVCEALGFTAPRMLYFGSNECHELAAAHYNPSTRSIHFKYRPPISIRTVLHELAHHIHSLDNSEVLDRSIHGAHFLWIEALCFETAGIKLQDLDRSGAP